MYNNFMDKRDILFHIVHALMVLKLYNEYVHVSVWFTKIILSSYSCVAYFICHFIMHRDFNVLSITKVVMPSQAIAQTVN